MPLRQCGRLPRTGARSRTRLHCGQRTRDYRCGEIVVGSGSGSQLGAYAYASGNVILVVGHQKLVRDLDQGLRRVREYSLPREYVRMQEAGFPGSLLAKTLIIHYEPSGRISVILVPEALGF
jgi:hypothetical protein